MTVDEMFTDVTENAIEQANQLLAFLAERANKDWEKVFTEALGDTELELNLRNVAQALERADKTRPLGAVFGGTGVAKAEAGLGGEDSQRAVRLLKQTGRLLQAGKGRGKALLIIDATPLEAKDFAEAIAKVGVAEPAPTRVVPAVAEKPADFVAIDDVNGLLKAANTAYRDLAARYNELVRERKDMEARNDKLSAMVSERDARIAELEEHLGRTKELAAQTTWQ